MVRVSKRYRLGRVWTACAAVLLGLLAGYFVGRASILYATRTRLAEYADQLLQHDEEIAGEVISILNQANASPEPPCSNEDIALLRRLVFAARFLKDVGRIREGAFVCSAVLGKLQAGIPISAPDIVLPSGIAVFRNYSLGMPEGNRAEIAVLRRSEAVISPDIFSEFPTQPIHFYLGVLDQRHRLLQSRAAGVLPLPAGLLETKGAIHYAGGLYLARCSRGVPICAITYIFMTEVWHSNRALLFGYGATGTAAGIACAMALLTAGQKRRSQTNQLKRAILMGKLSVAYQPIVELGSHRIVGAEALARWTDEDGESIRPETIIALAEAEGFVSEITRFVLTRSLDELRAVLKGNSSFRLSVNLAPSDLADPRLLLLLDEKLQDGLIAAQTLAFELTERATSDRELAVAAIRRLRQRGHSVFIDDFGTGYSNLAYLTELNVDGIKINRSFIATIGTDSVTATILPQILGVAKALSLKVVVQGIEREEQAIYFASQDPETLGQGWFFGMPIPARSLLYLCAEKSE